MLTSPGRWEHAMIKDLLVNLATGIADDATLDYAVSLARTFEAHAAGVAFPLMHRWTSW